MEARDARHIELLIEQTGGIADAVRVYLRDTVEQWSERHPGGTVEELLADLRREVAEHGGVVSP